MCFEEEGQGKGGAVDNGSRAAGWMFGVGTDRGGWVASEVVERLQEWVVVVSGRWQWEAEAGGWRGEGSSKLRLGRAVGTETRFWRCRGLLQWTTGGLCACSRLLSTLTWTWTWTPTWTSAST